MECELFTPNDADGNPIFVLVKPTTTIGKNFLLKEKDHPWQMIATKGGFKV